MLEQSPVIRDPENHMGPLVRISPTASYQTENQSEQEKEEASLKGRPLKGVFNEVVQGKDGSLSQERSRRDDWERTTCPMQSLSPKAFFFFFK